MVWGMFFKGLSLLFLQNVPRVRFIPRATSILEYYMTSNFFKLTANIHIEKQRKCN